MQVTMNQTINRGEQYYKNGFPARQLSFTNVRAMRAMRVTLRAMRAMCFFVRATCFLCEPRVFRVSHLTQAHWRSKTIENTKRSAAVA